MQAGPFWSTPERATGAYDRVWGPFHDAQSDLLGLLERAGIRRQDVDVVVNTHLHVDHVGWNTVEADGEWAPAFPNARYLIPAADDFHYGPDNAYGNGVQEVDRLIYEDSVAPIHQAGQSVLWDGQYRIDEHLTLQSAPGHTPGSCVLSLASGTDRAVFVGDLLHSPVQILDPCCNSSACLDPAQAAASRRRILERAAEAHELLVPAHFGGAELGPWKSGGAAMGSPSAPGRQPSRNTATRGPATSRCAESSPKGLRKCISRTAAVALWDCRTWKSTTLITSIWITD